MWMPQYLFVSTIMFDRDWSIDLTIGFHYFQRVLQVIDTSTVVDDRFGRQETPLSHALCSIFSIISGFRVTSFFSRCQCNPVVVRLDECSTYIGLAFLGSWQEERTGELVKIKPRNIWSSRSVWFFYWTGQLVKSNAEEWRSALWCV